MDISTEIPWIWIWIWIGFFTSTASMIIRFNYLCMAEPISYNDDDYFAALFRYKKKRIFYKN